MDLTINSHLVIPANELQWRFSRSSGPGGQGVNTSDSRVELVFDLKSSSVISPFYKKRLIHQLDQHMSNGCLSILASEERSQYQNRKLALIRMASLIIEGLKPPPKERKPTKPTRNSQRRRIDAKKHRGTLKKQRQNKPSINE